MPSLEPEAQNLAKELAAAQARLRVLLTLVQQPDLDPTNAAVLQYLARSAQAEVTLWEKALTYRQAGGDPIPSPDVLPSQRLPLTLPSLSGNPPTT